MNYLFKQAIDYAKSQIDRNELENAYSKASYGKCLLDSDMSQKIEDALEDFEIDNDLPYFWWYEHADSVEEVAGLIIDSFNEDETDQIKVAKTTFKADGIDEPCFLVGDDYAQVRISTCYHYIGKNTLCVTEFLDGEFNDMEEIDGDFNSLTENGAREIAKNFSAYLG